MRGPQTASEGSCVRNAVGTFARQEWPGVGRLGQRIDCGDHSMRVNGQRIDVLLGTGVFAIVAAVVVHGSSIRSGDSANRVHTLGVPLLVAHPVPPAQAPSSSAAQRVGSPASAERQLLDTYCVTCHNQR